MRIKAFHIMIAPALIFYFIFLAYPVVNGFWLSLHRWSGVSPVMTFTGLENYVKLLFDPFFQRALKNTLIIAFAGLAIRFVGGFSLAWIAVGYRKMGNVFLSVALMPFVVSFVAIGIMWAWIYDPSFGLINSFLKFVGLGFLARPWLGEPTTALIAIIVTSSWQSIGLYALIYAVGLQRISQSIYDSIKIDGLSTLQGIRHVILPMLKPVIAVGFVLAMSASFKIFDLVYVLTERGPAFSTDVLATYLYDSAFDKWMAGYASAIGFYLFIFCLVLVVIQLKLIRE
jgi:ABC-type sugar transport system permease subunit